MNDFANAEHNRLLKANSGNAGYALMDACEQIAALTSQVDALTARIAELEAAQRCDTGSLAVGTERGE